MEQNCPEWGQLQAKLDPVLKQCHQGPGFFLPLDFPFSSVDFRLRVVLLHGPKTATIKTQDYLLPLSHPALWIKRASTQHSQKNS